METSNNDMYNSCKFGMFSTSIKKSFKQFIPGI